SVVVRAIDALGNTDASYRGTVHFTSDDAAATVPADYTFTAGDGGQHTFFLLLKWVTPGDHTLNVVDTANSSFKDSRAGITVTQATQLIFSGIIDPIGRGAINNFTVSARDEFGSNDPLYRGTVKFTSNDPSATLPANYTYVAADNGSHSFQLTW